MGKQEPSVAIEQLQNINNQIINIEKQYPFIITTVLTVISIIVTILTNELKNGFSGEYMFDVLVVALPIISILVMCYILNLFRQVALLRGYASYIEEYINKQHENSIVIWNSKYIDGFIENNSPNLLLMLSSLIAIMSIVGFYFNCFLFKSGIDYPLKIAIVVLFSLLLSVIAYQFGRNDKYRRLSYWKAKSENEDIVRVYLYSECKWIISESGVGKAISLQEKALQGNKVFYTTKKNEFYNVVHINTFGLKSIYLAWKCKKKNIKVIITAHTVVEDFKDSFKFTYSKLMQEMFRNWLKFFYKHADSLIAPTQYVKDLLQGESYSIPKPIYVISNGVDLGLFSSNVDKDDCRREILNYINNGIRNGKSKLEFDNKIIISVGLYIERKGILNFIELAKLMPEYKFIWFGHTSNVLIPRRISKAIKAGNELSNLYFPGYIDHTILSKAYKMADLFLLLSFAETEGLVVLEALASKVPIIVNDIDVYRDWLNDRQHCYKIKLSKGEKISRDTDIIETISYVLEKNRTGTLGEGYKIAKSKDLNEIGRQLLNVYKTI